MKKMDLTFVDKGDSLIIDGTEYKASSHNVEKFILDLFERDVIEKIEIGRHERVHDSCFTWFTMKRKPTYTIYFKSSDVTETLTDASAAITEA